MIKSVTFNIRNFFFYLFFLFSFIAEYKFLNSSVISYTIAIFFILYDYKKIKCNKLEIFVLIFFLFYIVLLLLYSVDLVITAKNIKYWLGSIIIYLYLSLYQNNLNYIYIFRIVYSVIIIESLFVNTFIDQALLYHTPHKANFFNLFNRTPSFGGIASVSGTGLVLLYYYLHFYVNKIRYFDFIFFLLSLILLFSTTAFAIFGIIIVSTLLIKKNKSYSDYGYILIGILAVSIFFLIIDYYEKQYLSDTFNFEKITIKYFFKITSLTFERWINFFEINDLSINYLLGRQVFGKLATAGDNGYLHMIEQIGIIGLVIFFLFVIIFTKRKKYKYFTIFLIILSNFHYFTFGNIMCLIFIIQLMMHHEIK